MLEGSVVLFALPKQIHVGKHTDRQTEERKANHWKTVRKWKTKTGKQESKTIRGADRRSEKDRKRKRHR